jgi:hypothetical protein
MNNYFNDYLDETYKHLVRGIKEMNRELKARGLNKKERAEIIRMILSSFEM